MTATALVVALLLKPSLIIAAAAGVAAGMRRASAAARHALWAGAIGACLALPVMGAALPDFARAELEILSRPVDAMFNGYAARDPSRARVTADPSGAHRHTPGSIDADDSIAGGARGGMIRTMLAIWLLVAVVLVIRRSIAERMALELIRNGRPPSARIARLAADAARRFNVAGSARVRISDAMPSPAVAGMLRPVVLLPPAAETWDDAELQAVLAHEIGHVVRHDCLLNLGADIAACAYWCNPLVRLAAMRMRREGERSCDDIAIRGGAEPGTYAELLVRVARATRSAARLPQATTAMSRARELESRLVALLDGRLSRAPLSRTWGAALVGLGVLFTLPAAALTVGAAQVPLARSMPLEPDRLGDSVAAPASERLPATFDRAEVERFAALALSGPDSMLARHLVDGVAHVPTHEADLVRDRSAWALSRVAVDGRLVDPLLESLGARDWRVQAYAAWALSMSGDPRAVPPLIPLVRHPVWRLRAMAAHALRQSHDPRALDAMRAALADAAWQVRVEAVDFVAAVGGAEREALLRPLLADRHVAVRRAAARAVETP